MTGKRTASAYTEPQTLRQPRENREIARVDAGGHVVSLELNRDPDVDFMKAIRTGLPRYPLDPADIVLPPGLRLTEDGQAVLV